MMNKEMMKRLRTAGNYQRKALRALFPEEVGSHLDVIEGELKEMFKEIVLEMVMECRKDNSENGESKSGTSKTKKVDIQ